MIYYVVKTVNGQQSEVVAAFFNWNRALSYSLRCTMCESNPRVSYELEVDFAENDSIAIVA